jgi:hypothetical protein
LFSTKELPVIRLPLALASILLVASAVQAAETERQYLSGKGKDDAIPWDFFCTAGQNANKWAKIPVPSNWELQGFGIYTYGRDPHKEGWPKVQGRYRRTFTVPAAWAGKTISLVFDGVMTDTQAFVNGESAGPMHQGGYYRFKYDVTKLVKIGQENRLEVTVDDESANASVNSAERRADYWNFAGIFRPVYLEANPPVHVERVAIDAKADGTFAMDAYVAPGESPLRVSARLLDTQGRQVGPLMDAMLSTGQAGPAHLSTRIANPRLWTAETPNLYQVEVTVGTADGKVLHSRRQRFGFRTIEVRRGDSPTPGLFVNGNRVMLKGANRHSFWPDSGRCLSVQISRDDILLMQSMNMNAVRMSHYPPDEHFLDLCDEMGLYVLDELAGWHWKYDTPTARRLVEAMITRDVNHPSILFWDNGNEGGWNTDVDDDFDKWDPQKRPLLHPWGPFRGINTKHYPNFTLHKELAAGEDLYMPTEFLHGMFDGGAGSALEDYWNVLRESKVGAGGFIWALTDEDVRRSDEGGRLDPRGNQAPDGIVGPYREKEGSFYTVKELWSPIVVHRPTKPGEPFTVENRFGFLDAKDCTFTFEQWQLPRPTDAPGRADRRKLVGRFRAETDGSIPPGATGRLLFPAATATVDHDVTALVVRDPKGRDLWTYAWPGPRFTASYTAPERQPARTQVTAADGEIAGAGKTLDVTAGDLSLRFSKTDGRLVAATRGGKSFSLANGPRLFQSLPMPEPVRAATGPATAASRPAAAATAPAELPAPVFASLTHAMDGNDLVVTATYTGDLHQVTYRVRPNGWVRIDYAYDVTGPRDYVGIAFDYPEEQVRSMRYLGYGPFRVWKNRLPGGILDVWEREYNDISTGEPTPTQTKPFDYPEFKGYYAGVRWAQLFTQEGPITLVLDQGDPEGEERPAAGPGPLYLQVLTPRMPAPSAAINSSVNIGRAGLAVLHAIPPIGSKTATGGATGPTAQRQLAPGTYKGGLSLYFGTLPPSRD